MTLEDVEGIGPIEAERLTLARIGSSNGLLEQGASAAGRAATEKAVLELAGVDSPVGLAQRNAAHLATTFQEIDAARPDTVCRVPSDAEVMDWIAEAKALPKLVEH